MTNTGRRPEGPGWYWYDGDVSQGIEITGPLYCHAGVAVILRQDVPWLRPYTLTVEEMPGTFTVLRPPQPHTYTTEENLAFIEAALDGDEPSIAMVRIWLQQAWKETNNE